MSFRTVFDCGKNLFWSGCLFVKCESVRARTVHQKLKYRKRRSVIYLVWFLKGGHSAVAEHDSLQALHWRITNQNIALRNNQSIVQLLSDRRDWSYCCENVLSVVPDPESQWPLLFLQQYRALLNTFQLNKLIDRIRNLCMRLYLGRVYICVTHKRSNTSKSTCRI